MEGYQTPQGRPMVLGAEPGVAAGAYTDIVAIYGPSEAAEGETVNLDVAVKNIWTGSFYVAVTGRYNGVDIAPTIDYLIIDPGQTLHFYFAFTMPNHDIGVDFWSFFWADSEWYVDDERSVTIKLKAPPKAEFRAFGVREYDKV